MSGDEETERLRSVALQNAREVVVARKRLEEQLLRVQAELREHTRVLEVLNKTGMTLASSLDHDAIIQAVTAAVRTLRTERARHGGKLRLRIIKWNP